MANEFGITWDCPGFCGLCHTAIAEFNGSDKFGRPKLVKLLPNCDMLELRLNTGSILKVCACSTCKATFKPENCQEMLESVQRGWNWEIENPLKNKWSKEQKDKYSKRIKSFKIIDRADINWSEAEKKKIKAARKEKQKVKNGS